MRLIVLVLLASTLGFASAAQTRPPSQPPQVNVMPLPAKFQLGSGQLVIERGFSVATEGAHDARIDRAVTRFLNDLSLDTGIPFGLAPASKAKATLTVHADHASKAYPQLG